MCLMDTEGQEKQGEQEAPNTNRSKCYDFIVNFLSLSVKFDDLV